MAASRPALSDAPQPGTFEVEAVDERGETVPATIADEHRLTLHLDERELVTLVTLGTAPAHLALGYLRNQQLVSDIDEIVALQVGRDAGTVSITTRAPAGRETPLSNDDHSPPAGRTVEPEAEAEAEAGAGAGAARAPSVRPLTEETLYTVSARAQAALRRNDPAGGFRTTLDGCALFANAGGERGELLRQAEDIGSDQAIDTIAGWMWVENVSGHDRILYTSARVTGETVTRCARMDIPFLLSRDGITRQAWDLARLAGITLIGHCRGRHYLLYTGRERFVRLPVTALA